MFFYQCLVDDLARPLHLSEQYLTSSQIFSHFRRQVNGLPQVAQSLTGRSDFLRILGIKDHFHSEWKDRSQPRIPLNAQLVRFGLGTCGQGSWGCQDHQLAAFALQLSANHAFTAWPIAM